MIIYKISSLNSANELLQNARLPKHSMTSLNTEIRPSKPKYYLPKQVLKISLHSIHKNTRTYEKVKDLVFPSSITNKISVLSLLWFYYFAKHDEVAIYSAELYSQLICLYNVYLILVRFSPAPHWNSIIHLPCIYANGHTTQI